MTFLNSLILDFLSYPVKKSSIFFRENERLVSHDKMSTYIHFMAFMYLCMFKPIRIEKPIVMFIPILI